MNQSPSIQSPPIQLPRTHAPRPRRSLRGALSGVALTLIVFAVLALALGGCGVSKYNALVGQEVTVEAAWTETQNQYQRRSELIPQLLATVKGAADFEKSTITEVTEARASVGQMKIEGLPEDQAQLDAYIAAQSKLGSSMSRLLLVAENYPQLTATQGFRDMQTQIEGTENRIAVARGRYIDHVRAYNTMIVAFPSNIIAGLIGKQKLPQLSTPANAADVPVIDFGAGK